MRHYSYRLGSQCLASSVAAPPEPHGVPEARCGFIVIKFDFGESKLGNSAFEVLRCDEDRGTGLDGVERGVVEGKDPLQVLLSAT